MKINKAIEMILAAAQTEPERGNIKHNMEDHYRLIDIAAQYGAGLIVFPEMSITGYERKDAFRLQFVTDDPRLVHFKELTVVHNMIIIAGAPIKINSDLYIGSFVWKPDQSVSIYTKQYLHPGEEEFFKSSFNYNPSAIIDHERIALAICADIDHPEHPENAAKKNNTIYIPSIFFSPNGIPQAHFLLSQYAKKHSLNILMSNFGGPSWGQESGGRSAFWNNNGELVDELDNVGSGLLIIEKKEKTWYSQKLMWTS